MARPRGRIGLATPHPEPSSRGHPARWAARAARRRYPSRAFSRGLRPTRPAFSSLGPGRAPRPGLKPPFRCPPAWSNGRLRRDAKPGEFATLHPPPRAPGTLAPNGTPSALALLAAPGRAEIMIRISPWARPVAGGDSGLLAADPYPLGQAAGSWGMFFLLDFPVFAQTGKLNSELFVGPSLS